MPADYFAEGNSLFTDLDLPKLVRSCLGGQAAELIESAGTADREAALRQALLRVDSLAFKGEKKDAEQPLSFPRVIDAEEVPLQGPFMQAVAIEAYFVLDNWVNRDGTIDALAKSGVSSYSLDDFSISFGGHGKRRTGQQSAIEQLNDLSYQLLLPYLLILRGGGVARVVY